MELKIRLSHMEQERPHQLPSNKLAQHLAKWNAIQEALQEYPKLNVYRALADMNRILR